MVQLKELKICTNEVFENQKKSRFSSQFSSPG